jgi:hypothetical protein
MNSSFWINSTIIFHAKMNIGCMYKANHVPSMIVESVLVAAIKGEFSLLLC